MATGKWVVFRRAPSEVAKPMDGADDNVTIS